MLTCLVRGYTSNQNVPIRLHGKPDRVKANGVECSDRDPVRPKACVELSGGGIAHQANSGAYLVDEVDLRDRDNVAARLLEGADACDAISEAGRHGSTRAEGCVQAAGLGLCGANAQRQANCY